VPKYNGERDPATWLEDYRLACRGGGAEDDLFIIRNLPLYLDDSARSWIEHLPAGSIRNWRDLRSVFVGNFQGTYTRPSTTWDLRGCRQGKDETLRDYIRRFSKLCNNLSDTTDAEIITAFTFGTTCSTLIHELGVRKPRTVKELLDLATDHAEGEDAVSAVLRSNPDHSKTKGDGEGAGGSSSWSKKKKKNQNKRGRTGDDNLVAVTDKKKGKAPATKDHFDKMLEGLCPLHEGSVKHKMRDCNLMKKHVMGTLRGAGGGGKDDGGDDPRDDADKDVYVEDGVVGVVFGGPPGYGSRRRQKLTRREVLFATPATPTYLKWSNSPITFDRSDHPRHVPQPGRYPLVVDPIVGTKRLSKVLMDGGSGLNLLYIDALQALGITRAQLQPASDPIHGVVPGKRMVAIGRIDLPVTFGTPGNFCKEVLTFEVLPFRTAYHALLGRPCYAKFMAVPNYTYLKLKMPGPKGVITVDSTFERAFHCDVESVQCADAVIESATLLPKMLAWVRAEDAKDPKETASTSSAAELGKAASSSFAIELGAGPSASPSAERDKAAGSFEPDKDAKEITVGDEGRTLHVGTELTPK
jgi:hypothetical protein